MEVKMGWLNEEETCTQSKRFLAFKFSLVAFICFFMTSTFASELVFNCDSGNIKYQIFDDDYGVSYSHSKAGVEDFYIRASKKDAVFKMASSPLSGGNVAYVQFSRGEYSYYFYDAITYARVPSLDVLGVMVWRNGKMISDRECYGNNNGLFSAAYSDLPRVDMDYQVFFKIVDR